MTGAVTWEGISAVVAVVFIAGSGVAGFLFWVWRIVVGLKREFAEQLKERDTAAQLEKERAKLVEEELRKQLSAYQVHAAERFATKDGVTQMGQRLETALEKLTTMVHESVERITSRVDRLLDARKDDPRARG